MDLQKIKNDVQGANFTPEAAKAIQGILDGAISRGGLKDEEKTRLYEIIDAEIERDKIINEAKKEAAMALSEFADSLDRDIEEAVAELEAVDAKLSESEAKAAGSN